MLLGLASACFSAYWPPQTYMLYDGFMDQGALCYIGYASTVLDYDAYRYTSWFYYYIEKAYDVYTSKLLADNQVPAVNALAFYQNVAAYRTVLVDS